MERHLSPRRSRLCAVALTLLSLAATIQQCCAASKVDHHTVKMHTAFIKNKKDQDFSDWEKAFAMADSDGDGMVPVQQAPKVFKDHYNLIHMKETGRGPAAEIHYLDDGAEFEAMVQDTRGWDQSRMMTYDEFLTALHEYVDIKHRERGALYDMAASIF